MKYLIPLFIVFVILLGYSNQNKPKPTADLEKTKLQAQKALEYCKKQNMNTDFCILVDMSLHSGVNRFFVWDFKKQTIIHRFLVGHGCCNNPWGMDFSKANPKFSNQDGSHCSSLGKYKIGQRGPSDWGVKTKYILHGLESTNSNAAARFIVFHSWEVVSDTEVYPKGTPEGWGCPTLSNNSFLKVDSLLQKSSKATLFWMYL
ncbi:MAG: peptidase [Flavobacteriaceae bacterium]|nr:MAG: peptidase [Flavobacteriaceae bacterium]